MLRISGHGTVATLVGLSAPVTDSSKNKSRSHKKLKVIFSGAHPDDPECGCGGTMALYAERGHEVISLYLTRGEAGISGKSHQESAKIRTKEVEKACSILKVQPKFIGQIDGNTEITEKRYEETRKLFKIEKPDLVFNHWPIDGHRDHRANSLLIYDAWLSLGKTFTLFYYEVFSGTQSQLFQPSHYVNISSSADQKKAAITAHKSQNMENYYSDYRLLIDRFRGMEYNCRYAEAFYLHVQSPKNTLL